MRKLFFILLAAAFAAGCAHAYETTRHNVLVVEDQSVIYLGQTKAQVERELGKPKRKNSWEQQWEVWLYKKDDCYQQIVFVDGKVRFILETMEIEQ